MLREREATIQDITTQKENLESKVNHFKQHQVKFYARSSFVQVQWSVEKQ